MIPSVLPSRHKNPPGGAKASAPSHNQPREDEPTWMVTRALWGLSAKGTAAKTKGVSLVRCGAFLAASRK